MSTVRLEQLARGAVEALHAQGVRIPEDVAVVGFDNWEPIATATRPALTTVDMNLQAIGFYVGQAMLDLLAGKVLAGIQRLPCQLLIRESSRPLSAPASTEMAQAEMKGPDGAS